MDDHQVRHSDYRDGCKFHILLEIWISQKCAIKDLSLRRFQCRESGQNLSFGRKEGKMGLYCPTCGKKKEVPDQ
jgi:hypothetical protein